MKQSIVLLFSFLIILTCSVNLNAQWYEVSSNLPSGWGTWKIDAIDSLTAIGPQSSNLIYITSDGGVIWDPISCPTGIDDISMISPQKIWFCNGWGEIYGTSNGGINWQLQFYDTSMTKFMNYIEMFDSLNGVAMGDAVGNDKPALFLRTTDGGNNWISMNDSSLLGLWSGDQWRRVDFMDINTGYFYSSGESPQKLYKTTNGGEDWTTINDTINCKVLKFYDKNLGIIITFDFANNQYEPVIYRTTDGGNSWEYFTFTTEHWSWGTDIEFAPGDPSKVWTATNPTTYSSNDTGKTWIEQVYVSDMQFLDLVFIDNHNGWLIGRNGSYYIYRTTNGGLGGIVSVDDNTINFIPDGFILEQNYPNPFNPTTKIKYQIPELNYVTIKVYDVLGNEVATPVNDEKSAGSYDVGFDGSNLTSGIYFYQLRAGDYTETKKMILLR